MHTGPDIIRKDIRFGFDTGHPMVRSSHHSYKFNLGEPTTTFDIGTMVPANPTASFTSSATSHGNLHGTVWDWTYYPNSNISADGGMEWIPDYVGPSGPNSFVGAWKMKKRPGGNSESNFSGTAPGTISQTKAYTVSVWCKTDQASMARIHINTTKDGSSYWGYASSQHTGGGDWERLSVTIPANAGNTSINTIRCQCTGTTVTADAYWRNYQVEEKDHATPFILGASRSISGSLIDLARTQNPVIAASFDGSAQLNFDGTDDGLTIPHHSGINFDEDGTYFSWEYVFNANATQNNPYPRLSDKSTYLCHLSTFSSGTCTIAFNITAGGSLRQTALGAAISQNTDTHIIFTYDGQSGKIYKNGSLVKTTTFPDPITMIDGNTGTYYIGRNSGTSRFFNGTIYIHKVYARLLNASEVLQNFNAYKKRFNF